MILQGKNYDHSQEGFHSALGVDKNTVILCRERILFCHFANTLQSLELFGDRDDAPRELTTVTGDLQRTLKMITDPLEYELTLLHFMSFHRLAQEAIGMWKFNNDPENSTEDKLKLELLKLVSRLKDMHEKDKDNDDVDDTDMKINNDINLDSVMKRIDLVKKSNHNFSRYMELLGHPINKNYDDIDKMINGLFD